MKYITRSEADTMAFAGRIAKMLADGDTVLLHGDLGAGKSVFARGVARALGVHGAMPSPTFTLMIPYQGARALYHYDLYRLNDPDEFYEAGLDENIGGAGVALVEWPEMADIDPVPRLDITIERDPADTEKRRIAIENLSVRGFDPSGIEQWRQRV